MKLNPSSWGREEGECRLGALYAGRSWAELGRWPKAETPQRGGPRLSDEKPPQAQTGSSEGTALGIQTGLGHCAPSLLGSRVIRNQRFFPRPRLVAETEQLANSLYPEPRPASRVAFCASVLCAHSERQGSAHWVSVSRPLPVHDQHDYTALRGQVSLTNAHAARYTYIFL